MRIALYVRNLDEQYQISVYRGVRTQAALMGIDLICIQNETIEQATLSQKNLFPSIRFLSVDGVLLLSSVIVLDIEFDLPERIIKMFNNIPCVSIGKRLNTFPSLLIRNRYSMETILNHLVLDHGYRKFLFMGGPTTHRDNIIREHVFNKSMQKYLYQFKDIEFEIVNCDFLEMSAIQAMKLYIRSHEVNPVDVVVTANDSMAIGVLKCLRSINNAAWKNCAVTGFDDIPQAQMEIPPLTTVKQPLDLLGEMSVQTLHDFYRNESVPRVQLVNTEVVIRNSCGCNRFILEDSNTDSFEGLNSSRDFKEKMLQIYTREIKSEEYLKHVSILAQQLNSAYSVRELVFCLQDFLEKMEISLCYFFMYPQAQNVDTNKAYLLYERYEGTEIISGDTPRLHDLKDFFDSLFSRKHTKPFSHCLLHLTAGDVPLGILVYEADDIVQPHICNAARLIQNAIRLIQVLDKEKDRAKQLEAEVAKRTSDLLKANKELKKEADKRIAVEAEVLKISEMERLRFSLDLHDDICQRLAGISMFCSSMKSAGEPVLKDLSSMIDETLTRTRQYAHDFFPLELDTLGLQEALESLCMNVQKQTGCVCEYVWKIDSEIQLTVAQKMNIFRIIQEGMQNVIKHSKASYVKLSALCTADTVTFSLEDNGTGKIEKSIAPNSKAQKRQALGSGMGLKSMEYRAHQIDAGYTWKSESGKGTSIKITIPLRETTQ